MADTRYKKVEPKGPSQEAKMIVEAISSLPTTDNKSLEDKLEVLTAELKKANEQRQEMLRASQESSKAFQKEVVASLGEIANIKLEASQEVSEPVDVEALLKGMAKLMPSPQEVPQLDVEGLVEKVFNLTNREAVVPTYNFEIERNHSGLLVGIKATPVEV